MMVIYIMKNQNKNSVTWRCVSYYFDLHCPEVIHIDSQKTTGDDEF